MSNATCPSSTSWTVTACALIMTASVTTATESRMPPTAREVPGQGATLGGPRRSLTVTSGENPYEIIAGCGVGLVDLRAMGGAGGRDDDLVVTTPGQAESAAARFDLLFSGLLQRLYRRAVLL